MPTPPVAPRRRSRPGPSRAWLLAIVLVLVPGALAGCGDDGPEAGGAAEPFNGAVLEPALDVSGASLPDVTVGGAGASYDFRGDDDGFALVYFGYTGCPDVCPTSMADLARALDRLSPEAVDRLEVALVTVDPARDTPEVLTRYLSHFFPERFHAVRTDDLAALAGVEEAFGASHEIAPHEPGEAYEVAHSAFLTAVDAEGRAVIQWPFGTSAGDLAEDLARLLAGEVPTGAGAADPT